MTLTLDLASEIARTAFRDGQARGLKVMSVVITDPGGHIRLAMRSDAQGNFGIDTALGKARSALGFGRSSWSLQKTFVDPCGVAAITAATGGAFVPLGGGVVVQRDGVTVGAASISGGMPDVDHEVIVAAVEAAGLSVLS
jgi:uncharacterized protein GlcG (DUF336 family)